MREFDMLVWILNFKQGNSYDIWHFQTGNFIWNLAVWNEIWQSNQGNSYENWHFQTWRFMWDLGLPIKEIQMLILGTSTQQNSYEKLHFQSGKPLTGEFICSFEVGYFQTGNFIWNWELSNRIFSYETGYFQTGKFQCSYAIGHFQAGISYEICHVQSGKFKCAYEVVYFQSEINLKLGHFQNEHFIWNLALASSDASLMVVWNSKGSKPKCEKSTIQGADFAGQDVSNLSSETKR